MRLLTFLFLSLLISSCGGSGSSGTAAPSADLAGFMSEKINNEVELVTKKSPEGLLVEQGLIRNGAKDGLWMTHHKNGRIKTITSYVQGRLNGVHLELNDREQVETKVSYLKDQYHGTFGKYKFGRIETEMTYDNGVLNGPFVEYSDRGKVQKKGTYKDGKQDGLLQFFNDEEEMVMEYTYKNGEKVSGGMLEPKAAE